MQNWDSFCKKLQETLGKEESNYDSLLTLFFNHEYDKALEAINDELLAGSLDSSQFKLYRLWIEILAKRQDYQALEQLGHHLGRMVETELPEMDLVGLRAIICCELDQFEGMELLYSEQTTALKSAYFCEFVVRYCARVDQELPKNLLVSEGLKTRDWVMWTQISQSFLLLEKNSEFLAVIQFLDGCFPKSPSLYFYSGYTELERHAYRNAAEGFEWILEQYPENSEAAFALAYSKLCLLEAQEAVDLLLNLQKKTTEDPDVNSLLGLGYKYLATQTSSTEHLNDAKKAFSKAKQNLMSMGLPQSEVLHQLSELSTEQESSNESFWAFQLNTAQLHDFQVQSPNYYLNLPVSKSANAHDLVFLVTDSQLLGSEDQRVHAVYEICSKPANQPLEGRSAMMKLIKTLEYPLKVSLELNKTSKDQIFTLSESDVQNIASELSDQLTVADREKKELQDLIRKAS